MSLKARILKDMRKAMKEGDHHRRRVTRMLLSEISYAETTAHSSQEIDENTAQNMIRRYYKRLRKTVEGETEDEKRRELLESLNTVALYLPESERAPGEDAESSPDFPAPLLQAL